MASQAKRDCNKRYDEKNTKVYTMKLNRNTDADIIEKLESVDKVQTYIKELIRRDISGKMK